MSVLNTDLVYFYYINSCINRAIKESSDRKR